MLRGSFGRPGRGLAGWGPLPQHLSEASGADLRWRPGPTKRQYRGEEGGSRSTWEANLQVRLRIESNDSQAGPQCQGRPEVRLGSQPARRGLDQWHPWPGTGMAVAQWWTSTPPAPPKHGLRAQGWA